ncbi:helix-turn-helix domain-containing protein [Nocardia cyriacigeorgica]|uniref:helix-turn-helix domain-containing protein n=1 Tax=Nocardia cyriacigeorgica TaxID=135487 RepID=UPI0013EF27C9|nr:XRE family transcriptional regulator [Nocardia cyriacigeorgica]
MDPSKRNGADERFSSGLPFGELGRRIRARRAERNLKLQELADAAQVSRSMISEVERGAKAPTILVLDRIAGALGTSIAQLLDTERTEPAVVLRAGDQLTERDDSGWTWRLVTPAVPGQTVQLVHGIAPPKSDGPLFPAHAAGSREWIVVETGSLRVTVGDGAFELAAGDSISYVGDLPHQLSNPGKSECSYLLAMDHLAHTSEGD